MYGSEKVKNIVELRVCGRPTLIAIPIISLKGSNT